MGYKDRKRGKKVREERRKKVRGAERGEQSHDSLAYTDIIHCKDMNTPSSAIL